MPAIVPEIFPDELLYSVAARWRDRMRPRDEKAVLEALFGYRSGIAVVELPGHLDGFLERLPPGHPYTSESLLTGHTTLPYYAHFLPPERVAQVTRRLRQGGAGGVVDQIGVRASRVAQPTHLQFCRDCCAEDRAHFGEAYWRRAHQLPGVFVCWIHGGALWRSGAPRSCVDSRHIYGRHIFRSLDSLEGEPACRAAPPPQGAALWTSIAKETHRLLDRPSLGSDLERLRRTYLAHLGRIGWMRTPKQIRMNELREGFESHFGEAVLDSIGCGVRTHTGEDDWLARILRKPRTCQHPLRHLLLMHFLGIGGSELRGQLHGNPPRDRRDEVEREIRCHVVRQPSVNGRHPTTSEMRRRRSVWLELRRKHPKEGVKALRSVSHGTYAFLYRWDRDWLRHHLPKRRHSKAVTERVDWQARDQEMLSLARRAVDALYSDGSRPRRVTRTAVARRMGHMSMLAQHLHRLPRTCSFLAGAAESRRHFAVRRLRWAAEQFRAEGVIPAAWELVRRAGLRPDIAQALSPEIEHQLSL